MPSVWEPGTAVRVHAGQYSGYWGTVVSTDPSYHLPINVRITGVETSVRNYEPDDLTVS